MCKTQPLKLPRPDLNALGIKYRRVPVLAIDRDLYLDSRCIIHRLEELFPASQRHPALSSPYTRALSQLIIRTVVDPPNGVFSRAITFIDERYPLVNDPSFIADRAGFFGPDWKVADVGAQRAEGIVHMQQVFQTIEDMLSDGRQWLADTEQIGISDFEGKHQ